ncbi:hypothetical protein MMC27_005944 [Xylographa pallens]|nr:hypothetical protein [Xylographa pallens]
MPSDLSTTIPRNATNNTHSSSDSSANAKPPHLRVLEIPKPPTRAPEPTKPKRQVRTFPPLAEQAAIQERAEKATIAQNAIECPICQEGFHHDEAVIRVEGCRHTFHTTECFQPWLDSKANTCPYCRGALAKLTPGIWQRGAGVVPGDFYFLRTPPGEYLRAWNGNHPERWALKPVLHAVSGRWHAVVRHRYEDVIDLAWDEPLGTFEERFGSVEVEGGDVETQEAEVGQPLVVRELGETIQEARSQLEALRVALLGVSPEQAAEAMPIYQQLFQQLTSYLDLLEVQYGT